ncbi:hypothetical protein GX51_05293 [Blastomyces parvus]|uniref:Uncharacterized protein n=1 Tax=Blastomyces parvus TaxID=2060905 RepID=A0A2B7WXW6_9EURO|nr:hypothetical protein GX51_05293 [Blastomyces parvus]
MSIDLPGVRAISSITKSSEKSRETDQKPEGIKCKDDGKLFSFEISTVIFTSLLFGGQAANSPGTEHQGKGGPRIIQALLELFVKDGLCSAVTQQSCGPRLYDMSLDFIVYFDQHPHHMRTNINRPLRLIFNYQLPNSR